MSTGRITLLAVLAAVGLAVIGVLVIRNHGLAADQAPGPIETTIARKLVLLSIPASARRLANPNASNSDAWRSASDHYAEQCAVCHGADGRGRATAPLHMYPPVPDLSDPGIQAFSDGALFSIIQHGVRWTGMPAFGSEHSPEEIWNLVSFVRHVPQLSAADLASHPAAAEGGGQQPNTIAMDGTAFAPAELTVRTGDIVTWVNRDPFPHNVTGAAGRLHSGDLAPDGTWQFRAATPGSYRYVCTLHPGMTGRLIVTR